MFTGHLEHGRALSFLEMLLNVMGVGGLLSQESFKELPPRAKEWKDFNIQERGSE